MTCPFVYPVVFGGCPANCPHRNDCPDCDCEVIYSNETFNNARRLASTLYAASGDPVAIKRIAMALHYDAAQLQRDMVDVNVVTLALARGGDD